MSVSDRPHVRHLALRAAASVLAVALALYIGTLAPSVTLVDSGELIVAASSLGVAHPPGFPLYVLLAHLATLLPFGNVALRVNFASALFGALATGAVTLAAAEALLTPAHVGTRLRRGTAGASRTSRTRRETRGADAALTRNPLPSTVALAPAVIAGLLMACSRTLWSYATIAEVYTLNTLLIGIVFVLTLRWRRSILEQRIDAQPAAAPAAQPHNGLIHAAALVFGLALGVHHVTVALTLPALAVLVYSTAGIGFFKSRRLAFAALWAVAGLAVYAYLPLAASRSPLLNWGDPRTLQRLWWHVGGRQYLVSLSFSVQGMGTQLREFIRLAGREFGPWWWPAGLVLSVTGVVALFRRDRALGYALILIVLCDLAYALNYDIAEDKDAYYLPAFVAAALAAASGARWLIDLAAARRPVMRHAPGLAAGALLLVPIVAFAGNFPFNNRSRYFIAQDYVRNILETIAPHGLLVTLDWQVCSPLLYVRSIEQQRRDVIVIDVNLLRRSWYFDYLRREYPELMAQTRGPVDAFLEDLRHWEQDPGAYERDGSLNRRIDARFYDMILAFVRIHMQSAPVYITQEVVLNRDMRDSQLAQALTGAYQLVPQGLVFQLFADRAFHEPAEPQLRTRGLADGTLRFDSDDVVTLKVLPVYASMLYNRGRYLELHARHEQAAAAYQQALALDPTFAPAQRAAAAASRPTNGG